MRPRSSSASTALVLAVVALAWAGCGGDDGVQGEGPVAVYVSLPLRGASGGDGQDAADGARLAALFTEDGYAVQNGAEIRRGREAIARGVTRPGGSLQLTAFAYSASENVAYIVGGYRYPETVGAGGRFVLALRSGPDGRWLIAADLDNAGPRR